MEDPIVQNPGWWVMVEAANESGRLVLRLRTDRPDDHDIDSYATAVVVGWDYPPQDGTSSPSRETYQRMLDFERALDELSMANGHSYLMNVATGVGLREWCYYTKDREHFMRRFNELLAGHAPYPLKVEFHDDPEWRVWREFRRLYERAEAERPVRPDPSPRSPQAPGIFDRIRKWFGRGPRV